VEEVDGDRVGIIFLCSHGEGGEEEEARVGSQAVEGQQVEVERPRCQLPLVLEECLVGSPEMDGSNGWGR